jgi:hypothetical protein
VLPTTSFHCTTASLVDTTRIPMSLSSMRLISISTGAPAPVRRMPVLAKLPTV